MHEADPSRRQGHRPTTDSYYEDVTSAAPDHVGRVDVLDVAQLVLLLVRVLDSRLHELADRRQALVPDATQTQHHWLNVNRSSRSDQKLQPKPRITTNIIIHESNRNKQHRPDQNSVRELNHRSRNPTYASPGVCCYVYNALPNSLQMMFRSAKPTRVARASNLSCGCMFSDLPTRWRL